MNDSYSGQFLTSAATTKCLLSVIRNEFSTRTLEKARKKEVEESIMEDIICMDGINSKPNLTDWLLKASVCSLRQRPFTEAKAVFYCGQSIVINRKGI